MALLELIVDWTVSVCLLPGLTIKVVAFTLGPPLEWVITVFLAVFLSTVLSDRAFDWVMWAVAQSWWNIVKKIRKIKIY